MTDYLEHKTDLSNPNIASVFDELSFWSARFGILLFNHLELRSKIKILDLACGTGFPLFELAHIFGRSCQVVGVDVWREALVRTRLKSDIYKAPNVKVLNADGIHLPFSSTEFDLIISNLGINNFAEPEAVLTECFRVAKSDANIVLTTNPKGHMQEFYDVYRDTLQELNKIEYLKRLSLNEDHRGTKESICNLLQNSGFTISKVVEDRFLLRFLDGSALFRHPLTKFGFLDGWRSVIDAQEENEVFALVEQKLNDIAREQGELKVTIPMLYLEARKLK